MRCLACNEIIELLPMSTEDELCSKCLSIALDAAVQNWTEEAIRRWFCIEHEKSIEEEE